jgi:vesicle transport protein SEC22
MLLSTMITRVGDSLPLAASVDDEEKEAALSEAKQNAKVIFRKLTPSSEPACSIESGLHALQSVFAGSALMLCPERLCDPAI